MAAFLWREGSNGFEANDIAGILLLFGLGLLLILKKGRFFKRENPLEPEQQLKEKNAVSNRKKRNQCPVCGGKLSWPRVRVKVNDGVVCALCKLFVSVPELTTVKEIAAYREINEQRFREFKKTTEITEFMRETVTIDDTRQYFYVGKAEKVIQSLTLVCAFQEVESYNVEMVGERTVVKSKWMLVRTLIGALLMGRKGAILGAASSNYKIKTVGGIKVVHINMRMPSGQKTISAYNAPEGLTRFLDYCIEAREAAIEAELALRQKKAKTGSAADKLMKWKALFDQGVITQSEFEAMKAQLLKL